MGAHILNARFSRILFTTWELKLEDCSRTLMLLTPEKRVVIVHSDSPLRNEQARALTSSPGNHLPYCW
jgi:hypothetical protein